MTFAIIPSRKRKGHPKDVNAIARQKIGRLRDGMDKKAFDRNFDSIKWKSKEKKT